MMLATVLWMMASICDPQVCGDVNFEEFEVGTYPTIDAVTDEMLVRIYQIGTVTEFIPLEVVASPIPTPDGWLELSLKLGDDTTINFDPPAGKLHLSLTRTEIEPEADIWLICYSDRDSNGRYIGGMTLRCPEDLVTPQVINLYFNPVDRTFGSCRLLTPMAGYVMDRMLVDPRPFPPSKLFERKGKGHAR